MNRIVPLDPATYQRHWIHSTERNWPETNCYCDVIIELLHGLGRDPVAGLAFTLAIDFEGDQWTFFKYPHGDLLDLYGLDVQELAVWRPLTDHISDLTAAGRPVLVELDSYFLPDTAGTAYRRAHVKSTVAVNEIDVAGRRLGYFHNQSYHWLQGADFDEVFQTGGLVHERMLPPYFEYVKIPRKEPDRDESLLDTSLASLRRHLSRAPVGNPFVRFEAGFRKDLEWLMASGIETFHAYSFATLRQYGAGFELGETYLRWLGGQGVEEVGSAADQFQSIAQSAKALQFNLARSMARQRALDLSPLDAMAANWDAGMSLLRRRFS